MQYECLISWEKAFDTDRLRPNVNLISIFFLFFVFRSVLVSLVSAAVGTSRGGSLKLLSTNARQVWVA